MSTAGSPGIDFTSKKLTSTIPRSCGAMNSKRRAMYETIFRIRLPH
jgi:hypothetical protein